MRIINTYARNAIFIFALLARLGFASDFGEAKNRLESFEKYEAIIRTCQDNTASQFEAMYKNAPDFNSARDLIVWTGKNLPSSMKTFFVQNGRSLRKNLKEYRRVGVSFTPFYNIRALVVCPFQYNYFSFEIT